MDHLEIPTTFAALGASNAFQLSGVLPQDKARLLRELDTILETASEAELRQYRAQLPHL